MISKQGVIVTYMAVLFIACDKQEVAYLPEDAHTEGEYQVVPTIVGTSMPLCNCQCNQGNTIQEGKHGE